ncbi:MAG: hypothetical protein K6G11_02530 [Lachnospiraceae bacterium]|nr:hypothetical protein [Lachnospiraceae bacterium]
MKNNDILEKRIYLSILYDFYGPLLKDEYKEIFELYVMEDYGISEIAKLKDKSRQAVFETIKRVSVKLEKYEEKLCLYKRFEEEKQVIRDIKSRIQNVFREDSDNDSLKSLDEDVSVEQCIELINELTREKKDIKNALDDIISELEQIIDDEG